MPDAFILHRIFNSLASPSEHMLCKSLIVAHSMPIHFSKSVIVVWLAGAEVMTIFNVISCTVYMLFLQAFGDEALNWCECIPNCEAWFCHVWKIHLDHCFWTETSIPLHPIWLSPVSQLRFYKYLAINLWYDSTYAINEDPVILEYFSSHDSYDRQQAHFKHDFVNTAESDNPHTWIYI